MLVILTSPLSDPLKKIPVIAERTKIQPKAAYHHGDLRSELVNASRALILEHGSDQFSISAACRAAGVSTAAPYRHFSDKNDILIAVKIDGLQRMAGLMRERAVEHPRGTHESIAAIGESYVEFAMAQPNIFRLMFDHVAEHDNKCLVEEAGQNTYDILLSEVALFFGRRCIDEDILRAAFPLWTFVHGASFLAIDQLLDASRLAIDIGGLVDDAVARLLGPKPA